MGGPKDCNPSLNKVPWGSPAIKPFSRLPHWCATAWSYCRKGTGMLSLHSWADLLPFLTFSGPLKREWCTSYFKNLTEFPLRFSPCSTNKQTNNQLTSRSLGAPLAAAATQHLHIWEQCQGKELFWGVFTLSLLRKYFWQLALEIPECSLLPAGLWSCRQVKHRQNILTASFLYAQALFWLLTETQSLPFIKLWSKQ